MKVLSHPAHGNLKSLNRETGLVLGSLRRSSSHLKGFFRSELDGGECQLINRHLCH